MNWIVNSSFLNFLNHENLKDSCLGPSCTDIKEYLNQVAEREQKCISQGAGGRDYWGPRCCVATDRKQEGEINGIHPLMRQSHHALTTSRRNHFLLLSQGWQGTLSQWISHMQARTIYLTMPCNSSVWIILPLITMKGLYVNMCVNVHKYLYS